MVQKGRKKFQEGQLPPLPPYFPRLCNMANRNSVAAKGVGRKYSRKRGPNGIKDRKIAKKSKEKKSIIFLLFQLLDVIW